jgi:hypothetical protein
MVISNKHKYLFIELPRTGTTAISHELIRNYEGKKILHKHATYEEFLKSEYNVDEYFTFSCRRKPIDRVYSYYIKMKNGYYDYKKDRKKSLYEKLYLMPTIKWIKKNNITFDEFLKKKYRLPYVDWSIQNHQLFDYVIDFKSLNEDFNTALCKIGITPVRDLPKRNVTTEKRQSYAIQELDKNIVGKIFGPFIIENNYEFSHFNLKEYTSRLDMVKYKIIKFIYKQYLKYR